MAQTLFVGDVHGCAAELADLLDTVSFTAGSDRLLLTGDAFSRGPDPVGVWEALRATGATMVLGNHDDRLLRQLRTAMSGSAVPFRRPHHRATCEALLPVADGLLPWLESLPLYMEGTLAASAPAGPPSGESGRQAGFILVHAGINPERGLRGTKRDEFLTIRTWPPSESLEGPRWHDALVPPSGTIVFGHDAPGGLTVKRAAPGRRPWLVGLDSGCVYGGHLSAWIAEEDRLVQVRSRQPRRWS